MSVSSASIRADFTGAGTTGPFTFPFPLFNINNLKVITTDLNGNDTILVLNAGFTATGIKAPSDFTNGGTITLISNLTSGWHLAILSNEPGTQLTSIKNNSQYYAYLHENEFDQLSLFDLQILEKSNKTLVAPDSEPAGTANLTLPHAAKRANNYLGFDSNGNVICVSTIPVGSIISGVAFASLPTPQTTTVFAQCTDGPLAVYNTVLGSWQKIGLVGP